jgi:hypothetical protein
VSVSVEKIRQLLGVVGKENQVKLRVLHQAVTESLKAYRNNYSTANLKAWKAAERELEDFVDQLQSDIEDAAAGDESFTSLAEVLRHLDKDGWKVSQTTIYKHKKRGLIRPNERGRYLRSVVDAYAARNLQRLDGTQPGSEAEDEKRAAEIRKTKAQAEHWEIKSAVARGAYIPREQHEEDLAARAAVLRSDLLDMCRSRAPDLVNVVDGDPEKVSDLSEYMINMVLTFLDRYARQAEQAQAEALG